MILMNSRKVRAMSCGLCAFSGKLHGFGKKIYTRNNAEIQYSSHNQQPKAQSSKLIAFCFLLFACSLQLITFSSCGVYRFKDTTIPDSVKTIKISYIENKARYINPQISPQLTDALQQKVSNQTRLTRTTNDDANWQISGTITNYSVSFSAVSGAQTTQNNLTVGVHIIFRDNLRNKTDEFDVSRDFPFSASLTLSQAEGQLQPQIIKNVSDEIFNHIFSNW